MLLESDIPSSAANSADATNEIVVAPSIERLVEIIKPDTSLAIWEREIPADVHQGLKNLDPEQLPGGRILSRLEDVSAAVENLIGTSSSNLDVLKFLKEDIVRLAKLFADIAQIDSIDIRLEAIQHDACWRFHMDQVRLRLVTTYFGAGTQYVAPTYGDQALDEQLDYAGPIDTIDAPAVAIFKGARNAPGVGIVHRSPPVSSVEETRLLLVLNAPSDASPPR